MRRQDFRYELPRELIAQSPPRERTASRLLHLDRSGGSLQDRRFAELPQLLRPGDLLVLNDTRVIPARLRGVKETGGRIEILVERVLDERRVLAHVRAGRSPRAGMRLRLEDRVDARVVGRRRELFELELDEARGVLEVLEAIGRVPLPPYIDRPDTALDRDRYQTVYARHPGAVAAPTAGLHFDEDMIERIRARGVDLGWVTLHVGAGTFQPVRAEWLEEHRMHAERLTVGDGLCRQVQRVRADGGRVVAVGTTVVRALETAARSGRVQPIHGDTDVFIYPGHQFRAVDALLTNFHLPESTLLMLVCAFAGYGPTMGAYRHAVEQRYRFFSYGDAMFVS
ncbi:MAG: tRNA preQ1(34) S-adenosylmethionine ribosyltransferase-isomerase QueA [Gammaproteobacteria bacterium]|nr:tRNA preQ1(34) S-adenosylmethionine ribosyltransferase-isomerase QueA [Gammaproteobacteria bacterium]NIR97926.1 tRNA preQ1(34) S-adenosylmethionine ribosyltransferase-isomerase QueA [Gammaproteobacteria bacterium]NIT63631.1 tRNA preQ1(34) S-adenosylmethionine ribosyltransferase-isomerase QueA [Gammaproteobacteria bacterium]NIV20567.1 tRNA preQ1(34) S-adenosylmethionine ribosyltransferase-isomerase QueA [Gammaproteobacteria bacterium]NIX11161.1 tRNA preQ1(34) S-adenosylmethionine ribosyltrans